jgi:EmrB/QacA subfamily drug resistance transporter
MPRRWKVLALVSIGVFMVSLDLFIVNIAFPEIEKDFAGSSVSTISWVLNAYAIVLAALMVSAGRLADRRGRRHAFLWGMGIFVLGSALCGAAPSVETLVGARVIQAAGAALMLPTSLALLLPEFEPKERSHAIGIWAAIGGLAAAAGPPVGGLLVEISWRLVFLVNIPIGAAAIVYGIRLLHESRDEQQERPDLVGSGLIVAAIGVLALGLVKGPEWGWADPRTIGSLGAAAVGLTAFWGRCLTHRSPVIDPALLRVRSFAFSNLTSLLFSAAFAAFLLANVLFMTSVWDESVIRAGLSLAPGPVVASLVAVTSGRYLNRFGQRAFATLGIALFTLGCLWWRLRVGEAPAYASEMLPGLLLGGTGVGFVLPSLASASAASVPREHFATGSAIYTMTRQVGYVLGVSIFVAILGTPSRLDSVAAFDRGWTFMIIAGGLATITALLIGKVQPPAAPLRVQAAVSPRLSESGLARAPRI